MSRSSESYGCELLLDLHGYDVSTFTRESLKEYFSKLCEGIDMEQCDLHFWDEVGHGEGFAGKVSAF